jgi:putative FmdB family regulatory protein
MYEYKCRKCGHRLEKIQKFSDAPLTKCPNCGKKALEKLISSSAIQFKGSGWYVTDYAGKSAAPKEESSSSKPEGSSESKSESDSKSESKSESKAEKAEKSDKSEKKESSKPKESSKESKKDKK